ncbi:MAG: mechanosensitive ion channel family protein [Clostridia bacterium]|jgi:small-conductance mechanosensitive channel
MFEKISQSINLIVTHNAFPKVLTSFVIALVAVLLTKIVAVSLYHLQKKIITKLKKAGISGASAIETKVTVIRRIIETGIYLFAFFIFLQQFPAMRHVGTAFLASAGIAGIIIGMAAQNTLSNIIGGICISFSQPVRLDDAVIFRSDWGWVEEIALMHTIIRTWDNRRIVVPNNVLVNEVIENWTIKDPSLLGTVMMYVDYTCDVDKVRGWVKEIIDASQNSTPEKIAVVQVVDFTEKTMALRILCKASDSPKAWDLRCEIREKLIQKFKQEGLPLPQIRIAGGKVV